MLAAQLLLLAAQRAQLFRLARAAFFQAAGAHLAAHFTHGLAMRAHLIAERAHLLADLFRRLPCRTHLAQQGRILQHIGLPLVAEPQERSLDRALELFHLLRVNIAVDDDDALAIRGAVDERIAFALVDRTADLHAGCGRRGRRRGRLRRLHGQRAAAKQDTGQAENQTVGSGHGCLVAKVVER
ncbi:hypothetical protein D3C81_1540560 [compost metagenome]